MLENIFFGAVFWLDRFIVGFGSEKWIAVSHSSGPRERKFSAREIEGAICDAVLELKQLWCELGAAKEAETTPYCPRS